MESIFYSPLVVFSLSVTIWWFVLSPITIYYLSRYYTHRNNPTLRHRHWEIVFIFCIFCMFFWMITIPLLFVLKLNILSFSNLTVLTLSIINYILFPISIHGFIWIIVLRYYMIYYNIKFILENINMKWKIIINNSNYNPSNTSAKNAENWFLNHQTTYGSLNWISKRIFLLFLFIVTLSILTQFYSIFLSSIIDSILSFYSIPILIILYHRTPVIVDYGYNLKYELKYIILLTIMQWIFYFGGLCVNRYIFQTNKYDDNNNENDNDNDITFFVIQSWCAVLYIFCIVIICTKWTLYKSTTINTISKHPSIRTIKSKSLSNLSSRKLSPISPTGQQLKLYECLSCPEGFNCFMNHLMSEFSHECLLSTIEMIQWKQTLSYTYSLKLSEELAACTPFLYNHHSSSLRPPIPIIQTQNYINNPPISPIIDEQSDDSIILSTATPPAPIPLHTHNSIPIDFLSSSMSDSMHSIQSVTKKCEILSVQFPDSVPKSFIVYKNNNNLKKNKKKLTKNDIIIEYKLKAYCLFLKYISNPSGSCDYEININYNMRNKLILLMRNQDKWLKQNDDDDIINYIMHDFDELYTLFDECILEMYDLMCHSFQRFKKTLIFNRLDKQIFCKSNFPYH